MRILFLSRYQNTVSRGAETFVAELSSRLSKNHEVIIFSGEEADNFGKIIKGRFDIVVAMNGRIQSLKASLGRLFSGYKLVITGQSGIGRDDIWNIFIVRPDVFVALSEKMKKWAERFSLGVGVVKIGNGVDVEKFNPKGGKVELSLKHPIVLSVGALSWYKHHEKVIEALALDEKFSLLIVGKGEEYENLKKLAERKIPGRHLIKSFDYNLMENIYRSCDVFTLPSWDREAFGIVYLEALASGLSVVAPKDSVREEIVGQGGILVNVDNPKEYIDAIRKALSGKELSRKAIDQASKYSWSNISKKYEELFLKLIKKI